MVSMLQVYGGHKSNFGGHNKLRTGAVIPYAKVYGEGICCSVDAQNEAGFTDGFYNNTCVGTTRILHQRESASF